MGPRQGGLLLTRGQLGIWLDLQINGAGPRWNIANFVVTDGAIIPHILETAIQQALQESDSLKAVFFEKDGEVFQHIAPGDDVEMPFYDLRSYDDPVQEAYRRALLSRNQPMALDERLHRYALYQVSTD